MSAGPDDDDLPGLVEAGDLENRREQARRLRDGLAAGDGPSATDDPVARLIQRAWTRYEEKSYHAAIGLADEALATDPARPRAWRCKAYSLARLGNPDRAIEELRRARPLVAAAQRREIDAVLADLVRHRTAKQVEDARKALRRGRPDDAARLLGGCAAAFGDDEDFRRRRTYAEDRADAAEQRRSPTDASRLGHAALQSVLEWLCADELRHAGRLAEEGRRLEAADVYLNALRLDRRYTRAALLRANALYRHCAATESKNSTARNAKLWKESAEGLAEAARLARYAGEDRALAEEAAQLTTWIADARTQARKLAAYYDCCARYDSLIDHFFEKRNMRNILDYSNFERSFAPLAIKVDRLVGDYGTGDPQIGKGLADLADAIGSIRKLMR